MSCRCLLRSDWVIAQPVRKNRLVNRTRFNSFFIRFSSVRYIRVACHTLRLAHVKGNRQVPHERIVSCSGAFLLTRTFINFGRACCGELKTGPFNGQINRTFLCTLLCFPPRNPSLCLVESSLAHPSQNCTAPFIIPNSLL